MAHHSLALTQSQHQRLYQHLYPGDGLESVAIVLCHHGRAKSGVRLIANDLIFVSPGTYEVREPDHIFWPFSESFPPDKIEEIDQKGLSVLTIHSHPGDYDRFSAIDDQNDKELFQSVGSWFDDDRPNGSAIMLPDGKVIARLVSCEQEFTPIQSVTVVGEKILIWKHAQISDTAIVAGTRVLQTFGKGTFNLLRNMHVGVVGCSGTGSIVVELLARNCIGMLTLVDPDCVEEKNLNRIVNATSNDAEERNPKVLVLHRAIERMGTGVCVDTYQAHTFDKQVVEALGDCDVIFGCVDSAEGRYHLECLASAYFLPYFDVGVYLEASPDGGISQADAVSHYIHPGNADLMLRGGYTSEQLTAENWYRKDRKHYETQRVAGYLGVVGEDQPAVMSINMQAACMAFNDFLARIHGFRLDDNAEFSEQRFRFVHGCYMNSKTGAERSPIFEKYAGMGDKSFLIQKLKDEFAD